MHLGIIQSYPGGNADLQYLWPWTKRHAGFDEVLVTGPKGTWHPAGTTFFQTGVDAYIYGDHLPRKLTDSVECGLNVFPNAEVITCAEYDVWFCRNFPRIARDGEVCGIRVGGRIEGCESSYFLHWPTQMTRSTWGRWLVAAKKLLEQGRIERGTPDAFLALACEEAGIDPKFDAWKGFSKNTIHPANPKNPAQADFLPEARQAYLDGACCLHGAKSSQAYACTVQGTIKAILAKDAV